MPQPTAGFVGFGEVNTPPEIKGSLTKGFFHQQPSSHEQTVSPCRATDGVPMWN
jgi:hypothetical protein